MLLSWDVTVTCPLADSDVTASAREAGAAAELAAFRKEEKYANICGQYLFAHCGRNLEPYEHVSLPTLCQSGTKELRIGERTTEETDLQTFPTRFSEVRSHLRDMPPTLLATRATWETDNLVTINWENWAKKHRTTKFLDGVSVRFRNCYYLVTG